MVARIRATARSNRGVHRSAPSGVGLDDRDDIGNLVPSFRDRGDSVQGVYHESFHLLTSRATGRLPPWLAEGLAEFYSNLIIRGDRVELGGHRLDYLDFLNSNRIIPLREMVGAEADPHAGDSFEASRFYAQAWALVHFVILGERDGTGGQRIDRYIDRVEQGANARAAFEDIIGPLEDVERDLERYIQRETFAGYRLQTPAGLDDDSYRVEEWPEAGGRRGPDVD